MPWGKVLVALVCIIFMVQSTPCSWIEVISSWNKGYKAVVKFQIDETVDQWNIAVQFSEAVISFEAWKGQVIKISDKNYTISNTCYNNMVYSCQCFQLSYLVNHESMWDGTTTFKFNGEKVPSCDPPPCSKDLSSGEGSNGDLSDKCVGGKPENKNPKKAEIVEIRTRTGNLTNGQSNIITKEMDICEHGQFFTQITTYNSAENILEMYVPAHGYGLNEIHESTTYLLQTGSNKTIFDTKISIIGNTSHMEDTSFEIYPIVAAFDLLLLHKRQNIPDNDVHINHTEYILSTDEIITNRSSLPEVVQNLTANAATLIKVSRHPSSEEIRFLLKNGGMHLRNTTDIQEPNTTDIREVTSNIWFRNGEKRSVSRKLCRGSTKNAHLKVKTAYCYYWLQVPNQKDIKLESNHNIDIHTNDLTCCPLPKETTFASPGQCHCNYLSQDGYTDNFIRCSEYLTAPQTLYCKDTCWTVNENGNREVKYVLMFATGIEEYGCRDECVYRNTHDQTFYCFTSDDTTDCYNQYG